MLPHKQITKHATSLQCVDPRTGRHRAEHWAIDNQIYFITARCRDRLPAFRAEEAKSVFWRQLHRKAEAHGFTLIIVSLMDNHYHLLGHLREGEQLHHMMHGLHGSVARYVNQITDLASQVKPMFRERSNRQYMDGAVRSSKQFTRCFGYIERQSVRHRICKSAEDYPHTRVFVEMERARARALEISAFLHGVGDRRHAV